MNTRKLATALLALGALAQLGGAQDKIYWTDEALGTVHSANLNGSNPTTIASGLDLPIDVVPVPCLGKVFFTSFLDGKIFSADLDGSNRVCILSTADGIEGPAGLVIDAPGNRMFFTDGDPSTLNASIYRANLDGSGLQNLNATLFDAPDLAVDVEGGFIYYTEFSPQTVNRIGIDGSNPTALVTGGAAGTPCGIALDLENGHIYWADGGEFGPSRIRRCNLNGTNRVTIHTLDYNCGIALDLEAGKMYYSEDLGAPTIRRSNLDGSGEQTIIPSGLDEPFSLSLSLRSSFARTYCTGKVNSCGTQPSVSSTGLPSATAGNGFTVRATNAKGLKAGILIYGTSGRATIPFQGGTLCVQPTPLKRTVPLIDSNGTPQACNGVLSIDMNRFAVGGLGGNPLPELTVPWTRVNGQFWGRDTVANGSLLSNALEWTVCP